METFLYSDSATIKYQLTNVKTEPFSTFLAFPPQQSQVCYPSDLRDQKLKLAPNILNRRIQTNQRMYPYK